MAYQIKIKNKPANCEQCPLKSWETRSCGEVLVTHPTSGAAKYYKIPDKRCRIKEVKRNG